MALRKFREFVRDRQRPVSRRLEPNVLEEEILMPAQSRAIDGEPAMGTAAQTVDRRAWKGEALSVGVCATS
jgi:hypothetical protein